MEDDIYARVIEEAEFIAETGATVRAAAKVFHVSKSTVHKDVTERLVKIDKTLYVRVKVALEVNLSERHLRGGEATMRKYLNARKALDNADGMS